MRLADCRLWRLLQRRYPSDFHPTHPLEQPSCICTSRRKSQFLPHGSSYPQQISKSKGKDLSASSSKIIQKSHLDPFSTFPLLERIMILLLHLTIKLPLVLDKARKREANAWQFALRMCPKTIDRHRPTAIWSAQEKSSVAWSKLSIAWSSMIMDPGDRKDCISFDRRNH